MVFSLAARRRYNRTKGTAKYLGTRFIYGKALGVMHKGYNKLTRVVSRSNKPERLRVSKSRSRQTYNVERTLRNFSGCKYQGVNKDCLAPVPKPGGSQPISYLFLNAGREIPSQSEFSPLNLFQFPLGDDATSRVGSYMYIRKSHIKMEIQALPLIQIAGGINALQSTLQFRLIVVKQNSKYNSLGQEQICGDTLFLNTQNEEFGYNGTTATTFLNMSQPINKRKWLVYRDQRFILSPPSQESRELGTEIAINTATPKYNTKKYISFDLPVHKKCHFIDSDTSVDNVPDNLDTQWLMILQCVNGSYCQTGSDAPRNFAVNLLGTTSAYDN